jgi:hypothetical protein
MLPSFQTWGECAQRAKEELLIRHKFHEAQQNMDDMLP